MSKYLHRDVLDQLYKLYVRPHLDYCDIIYHKHDPDLKLDFTKKAGIGSIFCGISSEWSMERNEY